MKIGTYNVNGIRAALNKNLTDWMAAADADIYCLQEVKADKEQANLSWFDENGYEVYWHSAQKKGYSGVAIITRHKPNHVEYGCGNPEIDCEGRIIRADYDNFSVMSLYMPSGSSGEVRQAYKMTWLSWFKNYIEELKQNIPNLIICGDYNICHNEIDIHDPKGNKKSSGFLPEEREWLSSFIGSGFVDTFRYVNKSPDQYTWWTFRFNSRSKNKGWRIDYVMASSTLEKHIKHSEIHSHAVHSDHCPMITEFAF